MGKGERSTFATRENVGGGLSSVLFRSLVPQIGKGSTGERGRSRPDFTRCFDRRRKCRLVGLALDLACFT